MQVPQTSPSLDTLVAHNTLLNTEVEKLLVLVREQQREIASLRGQDADQAELDLLVSLQRLEIRKQVAELPESEPKHEPPRKRGHGPTPQPELPAVELHHTLAQDQRTCLFCGQATLVAMGDQSEDSEEITIELKRVVHRRQKYRCPCNGAMVATPQRWPRLVPGGRYSLDFAVAVATSKIVDHMPLHRQVKVRYRARVRSAAGMAAMFASG